MSSLWTPGGEVPVDRNRPTGEGAAHAAAGPVTAGGSGPDAGPGAPGDHDLPGTPDEEAMRAQVAEMQRMMLEAPAAQIVAEHAMSLYQLAVLHLSQAEPRLGDARLAIDALAALVDGVGDRLGPAQAPLAEALPQLKMAFVEVSGSAGEAG